MNPVTEYIGGKTHVEPRPSLRQVIASSTLGGLLSCAFQHRAGGSGGWVILDRPALRLGDDVIIPDLAGIRTERAPRPDNVASIAVVPDWVCEILSPKRDTSVRIAKMLAYARAGVPHSWLLDPFEKSLDVLRLNTERQWEMIDALAESMWRTRVSHAPFEAVEFDLALLWQGVPTQSPPSLTIT